MSLGLVLEGGGMRGMYTAGALDYFMERDFYPDGVVGVSAGACHGCSYVSRQKKRSYIINTKYAKDPRYMSFRSLIFTGDYFGARFAYHRIPEELEPYDYKAFEELKKKTAFYAAATDVDTGEAEYFKIDDMKSEVELIRASASMPLMSRIVGFRGRRLLDGGVADSIPVNFMRKAGYDKNIVILTQTAGYRKKANRLIPLMRAVYGRKYPAFVSAMERRHIVYNNTLDELMELEKKGEAFVLRPSEFIPVSRIEKDVNVLDSMYRLGYNDAKASFEKIKAFAGKSPAENANGEL